MNNNIVDICIIGGGVSGVLAALKMSKSSKEKKILMIELGTSSRKRRSQMNSFLGLLPNSNGQLFINDLDEVEKISSHAKMTSAFKFFTAQTKDILNLEIINDHKPSISSTKKITKSGFEIKLNNYIQLLPPEIHILSKYLSDQIEESVESIFNTEVESIKKENGIFIISTDDGTYKAKKVLLCIGRSGWLQCHNLFKDLGIVPENDSATLGIRIELDESHMGGFNKTSCNITSDKLKLGPIQWNGTVLPEDQISFVCSNFRSNENRWKSSKVSFNLFRDQYFKDRGVEEADRIGSLAFILTNDRVCKERISTLLAGKSKLSVLKEFDWLKTAVEEISSFIPDLITHGSYYFPTIYPMTSKIKLKSNFESEEISGLFVSGESARIPGLLGAAISGIIAGGEILK